MNAPRGRSTSLAWNCWQAAEGDPELALLLALDYERIMAALEPAEDEQEREAA